MPISDCIFVQKITVKNNSMSHEKFQNCIDACYECATACKHCANACLDENDIKTLVACIKLDSDCATMCVLSAKMMSGGSRFSSAICELCAEVCDACAKECEKHSHMEHCKKCAEACRKCAIECRAMSEMHVE
jgi:hypothetical protein